MDRRIFLIAAAAVAAEASTISDGSAATLMAQADVAAPSAKFSAEQQLANYAMGLRYEDLPGDVVSAVKRLLIDTLACAYGAIGAPPAEISEEIFRKTFPGAGVATLISGGPAISAEGAALVNGTLIRYLDLNDIYVGSDPTHPSECIAAAMALCEETSASGRKLIEAIVIGYETQISIIDAISFSDRGFHSLSCAGWAVPLMAGKLWGLSREQMVDAIGIAAARQMTPLALNSGRISMLKAAGYAQTAMNSIFATRMAAAGFTGASDVLAWFAANVKGKRPDRPFVIEKGTYRLTKVGLKRFPLQFELQTIAEAGVKLHEDVKARIGQISEIVVETYPTTIARTADASRYRPETKETADHSLPVCLALALMEGDVTIEQFEHDKWKAENVLALAQKIKVKVSDKLAAQMPRGRGAIVSVKLADGKLLETTVDIADGDPLRPMSPASLEHKFMQYAAPHLGETRAREALRMAGRVDEIGDVRQLMAALKKA